MNSRRCLNRKIIKDHRPKHVDAQLEKRTEPGVANYVSPVQVHEYACKYPHLTAENIPVIIDETQIFLAIHRTIDGL